MKRKPPGILPRGGGHVCLWWCGRSQYIITDIYITRSGWINDGFDYTTHKWHRCGTWICEHLDMWALGYVGVRMRADWYHILTSQWPVYYAWALGYVSTWICEHLDMWALGYVSTWIYEHLDMWALSYAGHLDMLDTWTPSKWICEHSVMLDTWICDGHVGHMGTWICDGHVGHMGTWICDHPNMWSHMRHAIPWMPYIRTCWILWYSRHLGTEHSVMWFHDMLCLPIIWVPWYARHLDAEHLDMWAPSYARHLDTEHSVMLDTWTRDPIMLDT